MPEIFRFNNIRFFFYSQDYEPVHVHVRHAGKSVIIVIDTLVVKNNKAFDPVRLDFYRKKLENMKT